MRQVQVQYDTGIDARSVRMNRIEGNMLFVLSIGTQPTWILYQRPRPINLTRAISRLLWKSAGQEPK